MKRWKKKAKKAGWIKLDSQIRLDSPKEQRLFSCIAGWRRTALIHGWSPRGWDSIATGIGAGAKRAADATMKNYAYDFKVCNPIEMTSEGRVPATHECLPIGTTVMIRNDRKLGRWKTITLPFQPGGRWGEGWAVQLELKDTDHPDLLSKTISVGELDVLIRDAFGTSLTPS